MKCGGTNCQNGFTLIELVIALGIFLLIIGAAFTLLSTSQQRYRTESQVLNSFQEARLGMDQMVRDINDAGFPPPSFANVDPTKVTAAPFGWQPGYTVIPPNPCQIGVSCFTPSVFDIIVETEPNPADSSCFPNCQVLWIRYQLPSNSTTLMRGVVVKRAPSYDPAVETSAAGVLIPFVQNVVNNCANLQGSSDLQVRSLCQLAAQNPAVANPVPIFQYTCDQPSVIPPPSPLPLCVNAAADDSPRNIRDVAITLMVADPSPDPVTGQPHLVQLEGRGRRINPNQ